MAKPNDQPDTREEALLRLGFLIGTLARSCRDFEDDELDQLQMYMNVAYPYEPAGPAAHVVSMLIRQIRRKE